MSDESARIPAYLLKWILGVVQAIVLTSLIATITWAWNSEGRIAALELEKIAQSAKIAVLEIEVKDVARHDTELQVLRTELSYIKAGVDDIKADIKEVLRGR